MQVFDLARATTADRGLWAAALLHDVGKAIDGPDHDASGADLLAGIVTPRIVWLVRHHLDLLRAPRATRQRLGPGPALADLTCLRRLDERGRSPRARVLPLHQALHLLFAEPAAFLPGAADVDHD